MSHFDYSDEREWWNLIERYAESQCYLPIDLTIEIKVKHAGRKTPMWEIPPRTLRRIVNELRRIYKRRNPQTYETEP